jgi:hypothetical protein
MSCRFFPAPSVPETRAIRWRILCQSRNLRRVSEHHYIWGCGRGASHPGGMLRIINGSMLYRNPRGVASCYPYSEQIETLQFNLKPTIY